MSACTPRWSAAGPSAAATRSGSPEPATHCTSAPGVRSSVPRAKKAGLTGPPERGGSGSAMSVRGEQPAAGSGKVAMPRRRSRRSGRLWAGTTRADGRWWHYFPGQGSPGGDHDQSPVTGADREAMAVMLLENAHDVGDLLAIIWAGPAPADNDPLTDVGRGEPDLEPVAHAGHLFRCAAPGAAVGLATKLSVSGDVAGELAGFLLQRAGFGSAVGRSALA